LSGRDYRPPLGHPATSLGRVRKNPGRREFQRAIAQAADGGGLEVQLTGKQGSGILTSMSRANCFIVLDEAQGAVSEGDSVRVEFFDDYFR
jgi:molybdopterin molybdotransferase